MTTKGVIGSTDNAIELMEPMKIARAFIEANCRTPEGRQGLWYWRGNFWLWHGGVWVMRDAELMHDMIFKWGEDVHCWVRVGKGVALQRWAPTRNKVDDVVGALAAITRSPWTRAPLWTDDLQNNVMGRARPDTCIGFLDKVVSVEKGEIKVYDRTEAWFDPAVVPVEYQPEAECPTWMRVLEEWSMGNEDWRKTLQMFMGYSLMSTRKHAKFLLLYGATRGGKGVITRVLKNLIGDSCFWSSSMKSLADTFGLDGAERAKVLSVGEVGQLEWGDGQTFSVILKNILGEDAMSVNIKHKRQMANVVCHAAPILSSNEIPHIPNKGDSITSKMLVLPFRRSFRDKPDLTLTEKLLSELPGIAAWCVQGAKMLEGGEPWPEVKEAREVVDTYRGLNNPLELFLSSRFVKDQNGFVSNQTILNEWLDYKAKNQLQDKTPLNHLFVKLETDTSWNLTRMRKRIPELGQQLAGIKGIRLAHTED
jgi:putative DNA primase/helicase